MHFDYYDFAHHLQDSRIERIILMMAIRTPKRSFLNTNEFKKSTEAYIPIASTPAQIKNIGLVVYHRFPFPRYHQFLL